MSRSNSRSSKTPAPAAAERPAGAPRIAYVISCRGLGGAEEMVASLLDEGEARGWRQLVLVPFADAASPDLERRCPAPSYGYMRCDRPWRVPAVRSWVGDRLGEFEPDLVHVVLFHATVLMATVARGRAPRVLTHVYGEGVGQLAHPRARTRLDRWAVRRFDHVSAISDSVHRFLTGVQGVPAQSVGRIRLGWRGEPLPRAPRGEDTPPTIVCVAVMRHEKGHDILLRAFSSVAREVPGARLVLVGDGPSRPGLEARAESAGLRDRVHFAGRVEDIWVYLRDADVFALASYNEALGIGIMEAMAAGLPVVASDVGGIPELVERGVTGELFARGDHEQLARHLIDLLRSPERSSRMSAAGQQAAQAMHMHESVREYFALYGELLAGGSVARPLSAAAS
ncbi:MAG: glycosyltransferase family 4 protein [Solirubrobacterales bacterium]|nr:glycosyltransferase family 4 protein [Solirubrobacterales bacterium]